LANHQQPNLINSFIYVDNVAKMLHFNGKSIKCAIGKHGATSDKWEGDGKTPLGNFSLRELFWRSDKLPELTHNFSSARPITAKMGWCDDANCAEYNQLVELPFTASCEELWRNDGRYDIIIPLGYNDSPAISKHGSAIFFHIAEKDIGSDDYAPTQGCIAISLSDMLCILPYLSENCIMQIA
jgi:L,D-peptidoglycan transpeptidase YkuD (ErfK/YbiS/YcfS/YnhG family)